MVVSKRERHELTDGLPLHASLSADANEYKTYKEHTVSDLCHSLLCRAGAGCDSVCVMIRSASTT
jgi:hypothetical protein